MSARLHSRSRHARKTVPTHEFKGFVIKVYRGKNRFSAHFQGPGQERRRVERGTESEAVEAAKQEIRAMSDVEVQVALREECTAAEILRESGISVTEAARLVATSTRKLRPFDASLGDAVDYFIKGHEGIPITVSDLVKSLLRDKGTTTGDKNIRDLKYRLENRFCLEHGGRLIQSLHSDELSRWLNGLAGSARNKRNYHAALVTLFEHGKENGYLAKGRPTEIQLVRKKKAGAIRIEIFSPDELTEMIRSGLAIRSPALVSLLIQGLAGVRHEEIEQTDPKKDRLRWDDLHLDQPFPEIHIRDEVSKTGKERFTPVVPALAAWLRLLRLLRGSGNDPVYGRCSLFKDYGRICRHAGIRWKKNGLRKSFSTYDSALSGSVKLTAKSAGNSAEMVRRYYRKEVGQAGLHGLKWFSVRPKQFGAEVKAYISHLKAFPPKIGVRRKRKTAPLGSPSPT